MIQHENTNSVRNRKTEAANSGGWEAYKLDSLTSGAPASFRYRVVIIDDHELLRRGFIAALGEEWTVAGDASNLREAKDLIAGLAQPPHLVVLDLALPDGEWGLELLPWLEGRFGKAAPPALIYSAYSGYSHIQAALGMGARGYVSKDEGLPALEAAMRAVARGGKFISGALRSRFASAPSPKDSLSKKEKQILLMVQKGWNDSRIMEALSIEKRTLENHLYRVYLKLGVKSRKELVQSAARNVSENFKQ